MRFSALTALSFVFGWVVLIPTIAEPRDRVAFEHTGIQIVGYEKPTDTTYDIDIVSPADGAALIRDALDILQEGSTYNSQAIERLKAAGNVFIIYDPAFPRREFNQLTIAAFFPDFFKSGTSAKDFITVVGRYGGKWSARELAPVLAHELTGHGVQHLRGRLEHVRVVDLECEAYLYQEKAYQDLGFNKNDREIVNFRQQLERHWCADFRAWQSKHRPQSVALWDTLNPDVPKILDDYLAYIESLRNSGIATAAIENANDQQRQVIVAKIAELMRSTKPEDRYRIAQFYLRGQGIDQDKAEGLKWLRIAAEQGFAQAQYELSRALWSGEGVPASKPDAAVWARKAAGNGHIGAAYVYGAMLINGDVVSRDRQLGIHWLSRAAADGHKGAKKALKKLNVQN